MHLEIPLIAAGGVQLQNVTDLINTGIHGVAVSAAVNLAQNPKEAYKSIHQLLY